MNVRQSPSPAFRWQDRNAEHALAAILAMMFVCSCTGDAPDVKPAAASKHSSPDPAPGNSADEQRDIDKQQAVESHDAAEPLLANTGTIEGTVRFVDESIPTSTMVPVGADPKFCGHQHSKEDYVIDAETRGVCYVIVYLTGNGLRNWQGGKPGYLLLDNKDCRFEPHAAVLTVGSTIELHNSDEIFHTTHAYFAASFNFALPQKGSRVKHVFKHRGLVQIRCDKHGWMNAFIRVDRHPFQAVTDARGRFTISGVPAGEHTLTCWHEQFGKQRIPVVLKAGETIRRELTYPIPNETEVDH